MPGARTPWHAPGCAGRRPGPAGAGAAVLCFSAEVLIVTSESPGMNLTKIVW